MKIQKLIFILVVVSSVLPKSNAQRLFVPSDTLNKTRSNIAIATVGTLYTTFSIGLYNTWYRQFDQSSFHFFNDYNEWANMDKYGHAYTAYIQGRICHRFARWAGISQRRSTLTGIVAGTLFQSTLEVMDGFSTKWGFSVHDVAANILGSSLFASQEYLWSEQRISLKMNSIPIPYSKSPIVGSNGGITTLHTRAQHLYGSSFLERFLKDYNSQVYWLSANPRSFGAAEWPTWLNIAVGTGAENMYGGFENTWTSDINTYTLNPKDYPRIRQFYLGFDVDFVRIPVKNSFVKSVFSTFDNFKIPSPALEINSKGQFTFHILR